ncbi:hypothetical protein ZTR_11150 [Talaromyces verruculosus]|nr:hypothetical protein ZTR_11150 [Talaromyces verruculosus]
MPTGYEVMPSAELLSEEPKLPKHYASLMPSLTNWRFFIIRKGPLSPSVLDMWILLTSGKPITQSTLAYVVDSFPHNMHTFLAAPALRELLSALPERSNDSEVKDIRQRDEQRSEMWFPTVVINIEAKMALLDEGAEWLALRVSSKQIKNGKFDLEVLVRDADGEVVALTHHVAMILNIVRNTGKRGRSKASL